ncbi:2-dehydro-3-deoxygluconokinase [Pseudoruegeria aquimaris]|uniref:2-dehydro-3-deoxygluconokinase n=1 Tax=Pseudoruegeria aquimaris TaxID=393663 RepID=A0A1Y5SZR7_9RHOB|nr:sugar kinase [Pseudoruegeria aquimaris]SLN52090.1 2-dehydro-3-deoxygluconokinase [Pseudoruegeria aquimaris]
MPSSKRPIRKIACVGEVMIELIASADGTARLGVAGDTFNTAVYLARGLRGTGARVSYVTALGQDPYSGRILSAIESHGIGTEAIERRADMMPGLYAIDTDEHGERSFSYWRSASAARTLFSEPCTVPLARLDEFDLVLLSGISMAILPPEVRAAILDWAERFSAAGGTLAYDSNHRPRLWEDADTARAVNAAMWARADIALPSVDDEMALYGDADADAVVARLKGYGVSRGALKRGAEGPLDLASGATPEGLPQVERVIDSTAAGDSFNAGFLAAVAKGRSDLEAAHDGHCLAAKVICHRGAIIPEEA